MTFSIDNVPYSLNPSPVLAPLSGMQLELFKFLLAIVQVLPVSSCNLKSSTLMDLLRLRYYGAFEFRLNKFVEKGVIYTKE